MRWPDEVPLFGVRARELMAATVGQPPFRDGPWPERRFAEDELAPLPPDLDAAVKARATLARRALELCPNQITLAASVGNLEGLDRLRTRYRGRCAEFQAAARQLAGSAKAFADAHHLLDDTAPWLEMLAASERWRVDMEAWLAREEEATRKAMKATAATPRSGELDLDDFPSGDDPF